MKYVCKLHRLSLNNGGLLFDYFYLTNAKVIHTE